MEAAAAAAMARKAASVPPLLCSPESMRVRRASYVWRWIIRCCWPAARIANRQTCDRCTERGQEYFTP